MTIEDYDIQNKNILYLIQIDKIQIFEENLSGKKIVINVESLETKIYSIKNKLEEQDGILNKKFKLIFNGIKLEDNNTLDDYNIKSNSNIILKYNKKFKILIIDSDNKFYINAESFDIIRDIKEKIKSKNGCGVNQYILEFDEVKMEDFKYLDDYNLELKTNIVFKIIYCPLIQIFVSTWFGRSFTLNVETSYTISDIKKLIQNESGMKTDYQILIFAGKTLEDEKTLAYYKIKDSYSLESIFHVILRLRGG